MDVSSPGRHGRKDGLLASKAVDTGTQEKRAYAGGVSEGRYAGDMRGIVRRGAVAERVHALGRDVAVHGDPSLAALLDRMADALEQGREREVAGYIEAIDPRTLAETISGEHSTLWDVLEVLRNVLVFAPIAVTWFGLSLAAAAYAGLIGRQPELVSRPFLLLWEESFGGASPLNFSTLAIIDASLIAILILLSLALHSRTELRGRAVRARVLLKESEIRALLGEASSVGALELADADADAALVQMTAEERRIYERAMEREGQLFNLETAITQFREAAQLLARVAESLDRR